MEQDQEQKKLPNVTLAIVLPIIGYLCCCLGGLPAILFGGIGMLLLRNGYNSLGEDAVNAYNYKEWKTARILNIIALVLGILMLIRWIYVIYTGGGWNEFWSMVMEQYQEALEQSQQ